MDATEHGTAQSREAPPGTAGVLRLAAPLPLHHGGSLDGVEVAWELAGDPGQPLLVVLGGISAGRHVTPTAADGAPGWWQPFVGPGCALDTRRYAVLGMDWLGGRGATTRPARMTAVDTYDQARLVAALLDHLGVARARAVVGASYGGMVALAAAALVPERLDRAVVIGAAHESTPTSTALRSVQRRVVRLGMETGRAGDAMRIARELGLVTYRSAVEFDVRFAGPPVVEAGVARFAIESYLEYNAAKLAGSFPPLGFLMLSQSCDLHRVDPAAVRAPVTLVAVEEDTLVPPWQARDLAAALGERATLVMLRSIYGHDAFLKDPTVAEEAARAIGD